MTAEDICYASVLELSELLTARSLSSRELVTCFLERIERFNRLSRAFIEVTGEAAMTAAERADDARARKGHSGQERSEEHTSELQSRGHLVCRLLLEKKKQ